MLWTALEPTHVQYTHPTLLKLEMGSTNERLLIFQYTHVHVYSFDQIKFLLYELNFSVAAHAAVVIATTTTATIFIVFQCEWHCIRVSWYAQMMITQDYRETQTKHHMCIAIKLASMSHRNYRNSGVRLQRIIMKNCCCTPRTSAL